MTNIYPKISIGRAKDLTGQRFGKLIVLYRTKNKGNQTQWVCQCDCGHQCIVSAGHLTSNHTTSCGCYKKTASLKDITNQKFGKLLVLGYDRTEGQGHTYWHCRCDCGTEKSIRKDGLVSGAVVSCGCYAKENTSKIFTKNLVGQRFGNLTVIERAGSDQHQVALWLCQCDCGTKKIVSSNCLTKGQTKSCGCIKSIGEQKIKELLKNNNISFTVEKIFSNCKFEDTQQYARFDFYVNNAYIIEYDGIQHFQSGTGWNTPDKFQKTQSHDKYKNLWCQINKIPLIRIPYTHLSNLTIKDLIPETSKFLYKGE